MTREMVGAENVIGHVVASALYIRVPPVTCRDWCPGLAKGRRGGMNTPSQCAWSLSSWEMSGRGWLVRVYRAHMLMMFCRMVLGDIVTKVFSSRVPRYINVFVASLVRDPKIAHFHRAGALAFYSVIGDAAGCVVVTVNGRWFVYTFSAAD